MFGDVILGSTAAQYLREQNPGKKIIYITCCSALTETNPYIDFSIEIKIHRKFDGFVFKLIKFFFRDAIYLKHWLPNKNILDSYMSSAGFHEKKFLPKIFLTNDDLNLAREILISQTKGSTSKPTIAVQADFDRKWNKEEFVKLKDNLRTRYNLIEIGAGISYGSKKLNFRESAALISVCDLFIGAVSGNLHAAAAVNLPTIATPNVFNPEWDMPEFYYSPSKTYHKTVRPFDYNFCGAYDCVKIGKKFIEVEGGDYSPKECPRNLPQSCVHSITAKQIKDEIDFFFSNIFLADSNINPNEINGV